MYGMNLKSVFQKPEIANAKNKADQISYSVTEINGGTSHNVTPQKCRITIDIRIPTNLSCDKVLELIDIADKRD